jgi:3-keto-disaccharide hydrolase
VKSLSPLHRLCGLGCVLMFAAFAARATVSSSPVPEQTALAPMLTPAVQTNRATGVYPDTELDDDAGFTPIFDGKTLTGWDGDTRFWRVENGVITGESTPANPVKANNFLIWRGGRPKDFELKLEFRINGSNSGVQYRSSELANVGKWVLKGYQADIDFTQGYLGNIHDERGRAPGGEGHVVLSRRGQVTRAAGNNKYKVVGVIGDATALRGAMNVNGWNLYHIIARGPVLMQLINGQLMAVALDEDTKNAPADGVIGLQMHSGPPFKIEYRNIRLKTL